MKLMTFNVHSQPDAAPAPLHSLVRGILAEMPDVIALQEVNQSADAPLADASLLEGLFPLQTSVPLRADNHAARAARLLRLCGIACSWVYLPMKRGYDRYDEGLALLAVNRRITWAESRLLSRSAAYDSWKTRYALAVRVEGLTDWFCCLHMGRWGDEAEPFAAQWRALSTFADAAGAGPRWLMGDFNAPSGQRGEGYDLIAASGWHDAWALARQRLGHATISGPIDGWQDSPGGLRIDHIWCSRPAEISTAITLFDGLRHPVISDHFGLMIDAQTGTSPAFPYSGNPSRTP